RFPAGPVPPSRVGDKSGGFLFGRPHAFALPDQRRWRGRWWFRRRGKGCMAWEFMGVKSNWRRVQVEKAIRLRCTSARRGGGGRQNAECRIERDRALIFGVISKM